MSLEREARAAFEDAVLRAAQPSREGAPCPVVTTADVRALQGSTDARTAASILKSLERRQVIVPVTKGTLEGIVQWPRRSRARTGWVSGAALGAVESRLRNRSAAASTFTTAENASAGRGSVQRDLRERAERTVLARHQDEVDAEYAKLVTSPRV